MTKFKGVSQIEGKERRFIESCFRVLQREGVQLPMRFETPIEGAKIINQIIASREASSEEKDQMALSLIDEAKQELLPLDEFNWFKDDERACYFVWASIYLYRYLSTPHHPINKSPNHPLIFAVHYNQLGLKNNPSNSQERFDEVVKYFDYIPQHKQWKLDLITYLKDTWSQVFKSRKPFSWLKKDNDEQCLWAWEYMQRVDINRSKPMIYQFSPTNTAERYLAIYAAFDTWKTTVEAKRLFSIDFNKAWQQKKHRDSRQGKKACSLVLHEETKLKLDELAQAKNVTLSQLVEQLINKEHSKQLG